jgi:hypothetical protein
VDNFQRHEGEALNHQPFISTKPVDMLVDNFFFFASRNGNISLFNDLHKKTANNFDISCQAVFCKRTTPVRIILTGAQFGMNLVRRASFSSQLKLSVSPHT